jgi:hypothetical protein
MLEADVGGSMLEDRCWRIDVGGPMLEDRCWRTDAEYALLEAAGEPKT